jgi:hypothetical protein
MTCFFDTGVADALGNSGHSLSLRPCSGACLESFFQWNSRICLSANISGAYVPFELGVEPLVVSELECRAVFVRGMCHRTDLSRVLPCVQKNSISSFVHCFLYSPSCLFSFGFDRRSCLRSNLLVSLEDLEPADLGDGFTAFRIIRVASNKPALDTLMIMQRRSCTVLVSLRCPCRCITNR